MTTRTIVEISDDSDRTAVEIFTQADDLQIAVISPKDDEDDKFGILISRGPDHRHKPLVSIKPTFGNRQRAYRATVDLLEQLCKKSRKILKDESSLLAQIINPERIPIDEMQNILTSRRLADIKRQLKHHNTVNTYELFAG